MRIEGKTILVYGLGISGISVIESLRQLDVKLVALDNRKLEELNNDLDKYSDVKFYIGGQVPNLKEIDLIVKSPGIPPHNSVIEKARQLNIDIVTDFEIAYILRKTDNLIAITGTNGKTTSTTLTGRLLANNKYDTKVAGNIGNSVLKDMDNTNEESFFVIEASSFQLEDTYTFKPKVSAIINLTPDHLDWHGNFQNYINSKMKIMVNQDENDYSILNYDDENIKANLTNDLVNIIWFSQKEILDRGIYLRDNSIFYRRASEEVIVVGLDEIDIITENAMVVIGIGISLDIDIELIRKTLLNFKNLPHRIEFVSEIKGVKYYNDSKGTNPDSTIKAIESMGSKIVLIAGGYNKGSDYSQMLNIYKEKNRALILLGETKEDIRLEAEKQAIENIYFVEDMKEAVMLSSKLAKLGDVVLLSPACASWGMYKNFEERGEDFIDNVIKLKDGIDEK